MSFISKHWGKLAFLMFLIVWQGIPAFNRWQADKLIDELCAKDGGVKVYETVTLPKERFDKWGVVFVADKRFMKPEDEFYAEWATKHYKRNGTLDLEEPYRDKSLEVTQSHYKIYRKVDSKLLGEAIGYARIGGEAAGPWGLSSYTCPISFETDINKQIFIKAE